MTESTITYTSEKKLNGKCDILENLSREISLKILLYLSPDDIDNLLKCCKKLQQFMNYAFLWKAIYMKFWFTSEEESNSECYKNMLQMYSSHCCAPQYIEEFQIFCNLDIIVGVHKNEQKTFRRLTTGKLIKHGDTQFPHRKVNFITSTKTKLLYNYNTFTGIKMAYNRLRSQNNTKN